MKLAVMLPTWIGDTCMATPALRALRALPELEQFVLVGRPGPLALLEGASYANDAIPFKPKSKSPSVFSRRSLVGELRRRRVDTILLFPNSLSSALIAFLAGVPRRIGYARGGRSVLLTDRVSLRTTINKDGHSNWREAPAIDYYLHLAKQLGIHASDRRMELSLLESDRLQANELLSRIGFDSRRSLCVINNSAASALARLWPIEHTISLSRSLGEAGVQVLIHAGPSDRAQSDNIASESNHPLVQSMGSATELPLGLSRGVLDSADIVVSTDSGVRHMAVALNKPVVSLFGPTETRMTRTYNVAETTLSVGLSCQPCSKNACPLQHHRCMRDLTPDTVYRAVLGRLARSRSEAA